MARTRRRLTPASAPPETVTDAASLHVAAPESAPADPVVSPSLLAKARAVAAKVARMERDTEGATRLAHLTQVREALTRAELTGALQAALAGRAQAETVARDRAFAAYLARRAGEVRPGPFVNKPPGDLLMRLGSRGHVLLIERSGVWRDPDGRGPDRRAITAYIGRGADPAAVSDAPFDQAAYLAANPDLAGTRIAPLAHYLMAGEPEGRPLGGLFDEKYYRAEAGLSPHESVLVHYARRGAALGLSPHRLFDVAHYLSQGPALGPHEAPLSHYLREGAAQGLSPHPLFDPAWYGAQTPDTPREALLLHYVTGGEQAGLTPHPLFDPAWYAGQNPEVSAAGLTPLDHYVMAGGRELRNPSPWFDATRYADMRGSEFVGGTNALIDYLRGGAWAVAQVRPGVATAAYLATRPEVVQAGLTPLEYWARRGGG